ncbi:MAG: transglutaminase-like domain-containing protein [Ginsengibacter sp.]
MKIEKIHRPKILVSQLLLLIIPAIVAGVYMLWFINRYYSVLSDKWVAQTVFLSAGLIIACILYNYRFRFSSTFLPLLLLLFIIWKVINITFTGEFSGFYAAAGFYLFSGLFLAGWLVGFGFARFRYFPVLLSILLLAVQIVVVSKTTDISTQKLVYAFAPVLFFCIYMIYIAEVIRNMNEDDPAIGWFISKKLLGFFLVTSIMLWLIFSSFKKEFNAIEKEYGGSATKKERDQESLTKENKDGSISNRKEMGMAGGRGSTKRLVFIAKLDNYFPGTENPNPLYFTYDYFTKFDTLTQTLETDSLMPSNDLFQPDPSSIPLYFTKEDSSVLVKAKGLLLRKVVTAEVYKSLLSPTEYLAPSTAFFCQPITVEKEYQQQFKSAYRAKMYVSDLNSAYFIYNPAGNQQLEDFQQQRFSQLRKVNSWENEDTQFMRYYTYIPSGDAFDSIRLLAQQIAHDSVFAVDKIIGIRNYFLSKDENGLPLFKYSDNPGIPGLPSASKLNYFLFENHKGYCAYFAGATLFLLRALGLPSRVATGFLTVDRSEKNKAWYWFYEDQAHAWVQVYFPGYGWIDFDTTVPSTEQQQSPAPDGTPPINVQSAYFVANGIVTMVDTLNRRVNMIVKKLIYHDRVFDLREGIRTELDVSLATISKDTGTVQLKDLSTGNEITALSFSETLKDIQLDSSGSQGLLQKIPTPVPIDEIKIIPIKKEHGEKKEILQTKHHLSLTKLLFAGLFLLGLFIIILFAAPWLVFQLYRMKTTLTKNSITKAYWSFSTAFYLLNQLGYNRENSSALQFANNDIDPYFNTSLAAFINVYHKTKYSSIGLTNQEEIFIQTFYFSFEKSVCGKVPRGAYFSKFLNFYTTFNYFIQPKNLRHGEAY